MTCATTTIAFERPSRIDWPFFFAALLVTALLLFPSVSNAQTRNRGPANLVPFWSIPISEGRQNAASGPTLVDALQSSDGSTILLATDKGRPVLLKDPDQSGPGHVIPLPIDGRGLRFAEGGDKVLWVGGYKNFRFSNITGHYMSEAYLAKLDRQGHIEWERTFGVKTERTIESMAPLPSGDLVVAGKDNDDTWLARISGDGKLMWERPFGTAGAVSVIVSGADIFVASFDVDSDHPDKFHREDVVLWKFDMAGELLEHHIVRSGININRNSYLHELKLLRSGSEMYLFSAWAELAAAEPFQVAKLDAQGRPLWSKELPELTHRGGLVGFCDVAIAVLDNGDPLLSCTLPSEMILFQLNSVSGGVVKTSIPIVRPDAGCQDIWSKALFLVQKAAGVIWVFGSRPEGVEFASCTWLGEAILSR